jgi:hypothetical protein
MDSTTCAKCDITLERAVKHFVDAGEGALDQSAQQPPVPQPEAADLPTPSRVRPGCVTLVAVLLGIGAGLSVLGALVNGATMMGYGDNEGGAITILITCAMAGLYFSIATGLWRLRNWARVAFLVLQGLGLALGIAVLLSGVGGVVSAVGLVVGGYTLYWFAVNGEVFRPTPASETPA